MLCSLPPLPLGRQNIPDGCNIPYYPPKVQFPTQKPPQRTQQQAHPPACHIWHCCHLFTSAPYTLLNTPALQHTPVLPSGTLGKSTTLRAHPKDPIFDPNHPQHHGRTLFFTIFWVVG